MSIRSTSIDRLFETILQLESIEECYAYFEDLCTIRELQDMAQRLDTAVLLKEGQSYQSICSKLGVSSTTVGRVNKCLHYGSGGYRSALEKLQAKGEER